MKRILSGIQPSGKLTLGNYLGALRNWVNIQNEYDCMFFVADLHSITVTQEPKKLNENIKRIIMQYIACGLDPNKSTIFIQSHVHEHAELGWILNNSTYMGELGRMTQYKDKSAKQQNIKVGLFDYPVLMAADILLYDADYVPVGEDQRQHLEMTKTIAKRFNAQYGETFKIPEPYILKEGAKIMSLQDPSKKMSKSDSNPNAYISLFDEKDVIIKKFRRAVTDSLNTVRYSDEQPGIKNLINIYSCITGKNIQEIETEFEGTGYGKFKDTVADSVANKILSIQEKYNQLNKPENENIIKEVYQKGCERASSIASNKLKHVYKSVGFVVD